MSKEFKPSKTEAEALAKVTFPLSAFDVTKGEVNGEVIVGLFLEMDDKIIYPYMTRNTALELIRKLRQATKKESK